MNLFVLHHLPLIAARWHHDDDVRAQPGEAATLLIAVWLYRAPHSIDWGLVGAYRRDEAKKVTGPWRDWAAHSAATYDWVYRYAKELATEHRFRFGEDHQFAAAIDCLRLPPPPPIAADWRWRVWPTTVPAKYLELVDGAGSEASVTAAYRAYYFDERIAGRRGRAAASWTGRPTPAFVTEMITHNKGGKR